MKPRSRSRVAALAAALLLPLGLGGCVVEEPPGPTAMLVTVHPWPSDAPPPAELLGAKPGTGLDVTFASADPWRRAVELMTLEPGAAPTTADARDRAPHLFGTARTLAEELSSEGFETGVFTSGTRFEETSGVFQGFLHLDESWLRAPSGADPGPLGAAFAAGQFVRLKIPRPLEDTAFAWLHLELDGDAATRATLTEALATVRDGLAGDEDALLAVVDLASADGRGALAFDDDRAGDQVDASGFAALFLRRMRALDGRAVEEGALEAPATNMEDAR